MAELDTTEVAHRYRGSAERYREAVDLLPRGVGSTPRAAHRPVPLYIDRGEADRLVDVDGNEYVDYYSAAGPAFLGNSPGFVVDAVRDELTRGLRLGLQHQVEIDAAREVIAHVPSVERVTFLSSGSEADQVAVAMARASTGRTQVIKFEGHYHGWTAPFYTNVNGDPAGRGEPPFAHLTATGYPSTPDIVVLPWNDAEALERALSGGDVAAVIMEPVAVNGGVLEPAPGFLDAARRLCTEHGARLILDEVITGFRLALGGAQERYGVMPDITVLAKAIASGFPVSAVGATETTMRAALDNGWLIRGTYNGAAWNLAAVVATIRHLAENRQEIYPRLEELAQRLARGIRDVAAETGVPLTVNQVGPVLRLFYGLDRPAAGYAEVLASDAGAITALDTALGDHGVLMAGDGRLYLSTAMTRASIDTTVSAFAAAIRDLLATGVWRTG